MIKFKEAEDMHLFFKLHPLLIMVCGDMASWCLEQQLPFTITETVSTLERDKELGRVSSSHRQKRAFDLRVRDWDAFKMNEFAHHFNEKHKEIAAISGSSLKPRLVVIHDSAHGLHAHIQLHSKYRIE